MNLKAMGSESERLRPAVPQLSDFARAYSMERGPALENAGHPSSMTAVSRGG